jgi:acyl dehydratase
MQLSQEFIGRKITTFYFPVERGKIREFCAAIGETNPIFLDPEVARSAGYPDTPVPPTFQTVFQFWGYQDLWKDMTSIGIDVARLLHMKEEYTYHKPLFPGDTVRAEVTVEDIRTGKMDMVTFLLHYFNQNDEACLEARMTIVIRPEGK